MRRDRARWDARYAGGDRRHDVGPSPLLQTWLPQLATGRALDIAAGLGRHALFLAQHGWAVDAVDISLEGLRVLSQRARDAGVKINLVLADLDTFACRPAAYDLIIDTFFLDRGLIPRFWRWLHPGGVVFFETHLAIPGGRERSKYALRPNEGRRLFARWDLLAYTEGPAFDGARRIDTIGLVARRPRGA